MKALMLAVITAATMLLTEPGIAQQEQAPAATAAAHYSRAQLKSMTRSAHTPQQYKVLADYYRQRQGTYQRQAGDVLKELQRRSQSGIGPAANHPRPVDATRNLYDYYANEAKHMGHLADQYDAQVAQSAHPSAHP